MANLDIHNYPKKLLAEARLLDKCTISDRNKELIKEFIRDVSIYEKPRDATKVKYYQTLRYVALHYSDGQNLDQLTNDDLKDTKLLIDNHPKYTVSTKQKYGVVIRKFYRWLGKEELVKWWKTSIKSIDKPRVEASDILTELEAKRLIESTDTSRDRAFISCLYELGARISEIGNARIRDCSKVEHGFLIDISGKTGHRTPIIIFSTSHLVDWLNHHPTKNNPDSPLWVTRHYDQKSHRTIYPQVVYTTLSELVKATARKANITKRIYPHLFRHSRATHVIANGELTESQAKVYFGWTPDSKMLSTYSHLVSEDANKARLLASGIIKADGRQEPTFAIRNCPICQEVNAPDCHYCKRCGAFLDLKTAIQEDMKNKDFDKVLRKLFDKELKETLFQKIRDRPDLEKALMNLTQGSG